MTYHDFSENAKDDADSIWSDVDISAFGTRQINAEIDVGHWTCWFISWSLPLFTALSGFYPYYGLAINWTFSAYICLILEFCVTFVVGTLLWIHGRLRLLKCYRSWRDGGK